MAPVPGEEKEWRANDQVAAATSTNHAEPVATEPLKQVSRESQLNPETQMDPEKGRRFDRTASSGTSSEEDVVERKDATNTMPWYKRLNPLRRNTKPPIPQERGVSPEYGASFLSLLTFQWMSPLMTVRAAHPFGFRTLC